MVKCLFQSIVLVFFTCSLSGCLSTWVKPEKINSGPGKKFTVSFPDGWIRYRPNRKAVTVTRDGRHVNLMSFGFRTYAKGFKKLKVKPNADTLPSELAEFTLAVLRKSRETRSAEVVENIPASIDGNVGFKLVLSFKDNDGLRIRRVMYGFGSKLGLYYCFYQAPVLFYFNRDMPAFRQALASFKMVSK